MEFNLSPHSNKQIQDKRSQTRPPLNRSFNADSSHLNHVFGKLNLEASSIQNGTNVSSEGLPLLKQSNTPPTSPLATKRRKQGSSNEGLGNNNIASSSHQGMPTNYSPPQEAPSTPPATPNAKENEKPSPLGIHHCSPQKLNISYGTLVKKFRSAREDGTLTEEICAKASRMDPAKIGAVKGSPKKQANRTRSRSIAFQKEPEAMDYKQIDEDLFQPIRNHFEQLQQVSPNRSNAPLRATITQVRFARRPTKMKAEEGLLYIQSANHAFFKNLPEELTSPEKETRITAVEAMRMDDKVYKPLQGPIFIPFAEHEENTIMALAQTVNDCQTMYSIERGGSVTGEKINAARRFPIEHHKITKHAHGTSQQSKIPEELITSIKTQYTNHCATNTNVLKIALAETCIGGGSVNALITMLSETFPTNTYPKLQVKLVILAQTIQNDIFDPSDILQRDIELIHNVDEVSHVKINDLPNNVELNMGLTPYITAEDVDYQANHQSRDSDKGIYFLGTNGDIVHTQPHPTKTTRETLVSIISGGHLQTIKNTLSEARMSSSSSR